MYFELFVMDSSGKSEMESPKSLIYGLLSAGKMWNNPVEGSNEDSYYVEDEGILVSVVSVDTDRMSDDSPEAAFRVKVLSDDFDLLEKFREPLVLHLKNRLRFDHIRILTDDVSMILSNRLYPLVNELEVILRRYVAKFFTERIGMNWCQKVVSDKRIEKAHSPVKEELPWSDVVATDMVYVGFQELGKLIYSHNPGLNRLENLIERVMSIQNEEELKKLQADINSNYNQFLKENFDDYNFDTKWKDLSFIREKMMLNVMLSYKDVEEAESLHKELKQVILRAEHRIEDARFSFEQPQRKEQNPTTHRAMDEEGEEVPEEESASLKILGRIPLDDFESHEGDQKKTITEEILVEELKQAEESLNFSRLTYVGLKSFVTKVLGPKGYSFGPTYALINSLRDKGVVEIYDINDENSYYPVKAVRML